MNGILKNAEIAVPLNCLSNFWRSLEMINFKIELRHKCKRYCVLFATAADDSNANPNNIIFTVKDIKLCVPVFTLSAKDN